jgi:hypothetical protein
MDSISVRQNKRPANASQPTTPTNPRLEKFFNRVAPVRGKLIFAVDATASRQPGWDLAAKLQANMFAAVAAIGGIDVQLVFYRGDSECSASRWFSDPDSLARAMSRIYCQCGPTQVLRVLKHAREENQHEKVAALILVSDSFEEVPGQVYDAARALGMPAFCFVEGDDVVASAVYRKIAEFTGGATAAFDAGAADRLKDLLRAVAVFAAGGMQALAAQKTEAARLLLTQINKR